MIAEKVHELILRELEITDPSRIVEKARFIDDLGADSLKIFALITAIEEEFDVSIDDGRIEQIQTVADAVNTVVSLTTGRA